MKKEERERGETLPQSSPRDNEMYEWTWDQESQNLSLFLLDFVPYHNKLFKMATLANERERERREKREERERLTERGERRERREGGLERIKGRERHAQGRPVT